MVGAPAPPTATRRPLPARPQPPGSTRPPRSPLPGGVAASSGGSSPSRASPALPAAFPTERPFGCCPRAATAPYPTLPGHPQRRPRRPAAGPRLATRPRPATSMTRGVGPPSPAR